MRIDEFLRRPLAAVLVLLAAGCATVRPEAPPPDQPETPAQATERRSKAAPPAYNLTGYPPAVRDGYVDGCESAKRSPLARKDANRFGSDPQYAMGWNDGFALCEQK